jgi:hypothetical protein
MKLGQNSTRPTSSYMNAEDHLQRKQPLNTSNYINTFLPPLLFVLAPKKDPHFDMGVITPIFPSYPQMTKGMEETIQNLVTQKIREALLLCGVKDAVNDPLKAHIMQISNLGEGMILLLGHEANPYST